MNANRNDPDGDNEEPAAPPNQRRRRILEAGLLGGTAAALALAGKMAAAQTPAAGGTADDPDQWGMMFDITVRIAPGRLDAWNHFWGSQYAPVLEKNGQWLWGAWHGLTGQTETVTHEWAYRDLTHFQAMAKMRATDPEIRQLSHSPDDVPILEATQTSVLVPLPYHPAGKPPPSGSAGAMIATRRVVREQGADGAQYNRLAADYAQLAAGHGAELAGAYQTFFGWTPAHSLEVWRYPSLDAYFSIERAIASDPQGRKLLTAMRQIWPHEAIALNQPLPYSRLG